MIPFSYSSIPVISFRNPAVDLKRSQDTAGRIGEYA